MTIADEEIREWLDSHPAEDSKPCILCDEPVTKDTVGEHLMERHTHGQVALLVALWWFMDDETEQAHG